MKLKKNHISALGHRRRDTHVPFFKTNYFIFHFLIKVSLS